LKSKTVALPAWILSHLYYVVKYSIKITYGNIKFIEISSNNYNIKSLKS